MDEKYSRPSHHVPYMEFCRIMQAEVVDITLMRNADCYLEKLK